MQRVDSPFDSGGIRVLIIGQLEPTIASSGLEDSESGSGKQRRKDGKRADERGRVAGRSDVNALTGGCCHLRSVDVRVMGVGTRAE
jgi:hypothetical protein